MAFSTNGSHIDRRQDNGHPGPVQRRGGSVEKEHVPDKCERRLQQQNKAGQGYANLRERRGDEKDTNTLSRICPFRPD